ncbi:cytochrome c-type biogenesis protein [Hafnia alvei]|uniref:cytochrome c-type biogenesis protein n=1 Tax=Hafnia alvei TaxID=569 RepID=UPI0038515202
MLRWVSALAGIMLSVSAWAAIDTYSFKNVEQEQQYRELTEQLRCPKCQNNSIADSNAIIASDMRQKVYELMEKGYTNKQITEYMVARYGNFITYEPPLTAATLILWAGPALFVLLGAIVVITRARRRRPNEPEVSSSETLSEAEKQRLNQLLNDSDREH